MEIMTYQEIIDVLNRLKVTPEEFAWGEWAEQVDDELGEIIEADQFGGEGQGDTWYTVKEFKDYGIFIKMYGSYSSYNGVDFYGSLSELCTEVFPATILKQEYLSKSEKEKADKEIKEFLSKNSVSKSK